MEHIGRRLTAMAAAMTLAFTLVKAEPAVPDAAEAAASASRFTIQTEEMTRLNNGDSYDVWASTMEQMRTVGLAIPVTEQQLLMGNPDAVLRRDAGGRIYMIDGAEALGTVRTPQEAAKAAYRAAALLGAPADVNLRFSSVQHSGQVQVYLFQQVYAGKSVVGSTVKVVTDQEGEVHTVFSSLQKELPDADVQEITADEAEEIVRQKLMADGAEDSVLPGCTTQVPLAPEEADEESPDEEPPDALTWIVYSQNPKYNEGRSGELPWLAHYVAADGTYLYANAMSSVGDGAGAIGYPAIYTFANMERAEWTGEITRADGSVQTLTVPVMRDSRTGTWYLGDPDRMIAVGDFSTLAYGEERVLLVSSPENDGWNAEDLITYANMIRVWDYYAEVDWTGPDGIGTPVLLLRRLRTEEGEDIFNAAYVGIGKGWQCFAYGEESYLGQSLDVIAHEFTHCVTTSLMNTNLYKGDYGAINEAMSDIMGNICELSLQDTEDTEWLVGENSGMVIRSMLNPHDHGQPEYVWDVYYASDTDQPNDVNDRGGVHSNSSILNLLAAKLCVEQGMSLEEARDFWFTVALGCTSTTDYPQMAELLPWALKTCGLEAYEASLNTLIADTRMAETSLPETMPEGQHVVTLELPEGILRDDPNWILTGISVNARALQERLQTLIELGHAIFSDEEGKDDTINALLEQLNIREELEQLQEETDEDNINALLMRILDRLGAGLLTEHTTWRSADGAAMQMVTYTQPTFYTLINIDPSDMAFKGMALYLNGHWYDILAFSEEADEENLEETSSNVFAFLGDLALDLVVKVLPSDELEASKITLSSEGLENVTLHDFSDLLSEDEDADAAEKTSEATVEPAEESPEATEEPAA